MKLSNCIKLPKFICRRLFIGRGFVRKIYLKTFDQFLSPLDVLQRPNMSEFGFCSAKTMKNPEIFNKMLNFLSIADD